MGKNEIKIIIERSDGQEKAFEELWKNLMYLSNKYKLNFYELTGILECLKNELFSLEEDTVDESI